MQDFPGPVVEFILNGVEGSPGDQIEVCFLRKKLSYEAVGVFVCSPFPGGVGVGKIDVGSGLFSKPFVVGHLKAIIIGHCSSKARC